MMSYIPETAEKIKKERDALRVLMAKTDDMMTQIAHGAIPPTCKRLAFEWLELRQEQKDAK